MANNMTARPASSTTFPNRGGTLSRFMNPSNPEIQKGLPKTIEGALQRYLDAHWKYFRGSPEDRRELNARAEAGVLRMRKKAPKFFEEKLYQIVNQAASALLACDTSTKQGEIKFHHTHKLFLLVLDGLTKSQPQGEADFQKEADRVTERLKLLERQKELTEQVSKFHATEVDVEDLEDEQFVALWSKQEDAERELEKVCRLIIELDGPRDDGDLDFELEIPKQSQLARLNDEQIALLEDEVKKIVGQTSLRKKKPFCKEDADALVKMLKLKDFTAPQLSTLTSDIMSSVTNYLRYIRHSEQASFHESLLKDANLIPKEGRILENPDDLPEEVKKELDESQNIANIGIQKLYDRMCEFQEDPGSVEAEADAESVDDGDEDRDSEPDEDVEILQYRNNFKDFFARVKEEPRDDYDGEAPSDDEAVVDDKTASLISRGVESVKRQATKGVLNEDETENQRATKQIKTESSSFSTEVKKETPNFDEILALAMQSTTSDESSVIKRENRQTTNTKAEEDDMEVLGIVEPSDKIPIIEID